MQKVQKVHPATSLLHKQVHQSVLLVQLIHFLKMFTHVNQDCPGLVMVYTVHAQIVLLASQVNQVVHIASRIPLVNITTTVRLDGKLHLAPWELELVQI